LELMKSEICCWLVTTVLNSLIVAQSKEMLPLNIISDCQPPPINALPLLTTDQSCTSRVSTSRRTSRAGTVAPLAGLAYRHKLNQIFVKSRDKILCSPSKLADKCSRGCLPVFDTNVSRMSQPCPHDKVGVRRIYLPSC
jgi:hypothetical protein